LDVYRKFTGAALATTLSFVIPPAPLCRGSEAGGGPPNVFTIHPDGTGLNQLTDAHGVNAHLAWSPDGERLLFCSSRMGFKDEVVLIGAPQPYGEVFVMRYDGTHVEQLTDRPDP
jgi:Tol biopolymer transport system component